MSMLGYILDKDVLAELYGVNPQGRQGHSAILYL